MTDLSLRFCPFMVFMYPADYFCPYVQTSCWAADENEVSGTPPFCATGNCPLWDAQFPLRLLLATFSPRRWATDNTVRNSMLHAHIIYTLYSASLIYNWHLPTILQYLSFFITWWQMNILPRFPVSAVLDHNQMAPKCFNPGSIFPRAQSVQRHTHLERWGAVGWSW